MEPELSPPRTGRTRSQVGLLVLLLVTIGALAHVAIRMEGIKVAYILAKEQKKRRELEEERRQLQLEIGRMRDPNRVVSVAREKLGLGPPAANAIRLLPAGGAELAVTAEVPSERGKAAAGGTGAAPAAPLSAAPASAPGAPSRRRP